VQCRAVKVDITSSRRQALSGVLLTTGLSLLPSRAWALIPDEEDEELLERAKANRQKRLAAQKETTRWVLPTWVVLLHSDSSRCHLSWRCRSGHCRTLLHPSVGHLQSQEAARRCQRASLDSPCCCCSCSDFLKSEGLADKQLDSELIPVQKAVIQLAKSGEAVSPRTAGSHNALECRTTFQPVLQGMLLCDGHVEAAGHCHLAAAAANNGTVFLAVSVCRLPAGVW
jgi:hypothetical protein